MSIYLDWRENVHEFLINIARENVLVKILVSD